MSIVTNYNIKRRIKEFKNSESKVLKPIYYAFVWGNRITKFIISSTFRNQSFSKIKYRKHFHQFSHYTEINRYPDLFEICSKYLKNIGNPKILSFGCSTGEEVFSLGENLPNAVITGADISDWCIGECQKKNSENKYLFLQSKSKEFSQLFNFDAILCLAVFQHPQNRESEIKQATKFTFNQFEKQLIELDTKLNDNGLLFIDHCDFDFRDTILRNNYSVLIDENNIIERDRPIYDQNNRRISNVTFIPRVHIKKKSSQYIDTPNQH